MLCMLHILPPLRVLQCAHASLSWMHDYIRHASELRAPHFCKSADATHDQKSDDRQLHCEPHRPLESLNLIATMRTRLPLTCPLVHRFLPHRGPGEAAQIFVTISRTIRG
jgi:hypothetical protein